MKIETRLFIYLAPFFVVVGVVYGFWSSWEPVGTACLLLVAGLAAMIGAAVILTDPIFQGLAISLLFGLASSTLLTVLVIPAIYIVLRDDNKPATR